MRNVPAGLHRFDNGAIPSINFVNAINSLESNEQVSMKRWRRVVEPDWNRVLEALVVRDGWAAK